MIIGVEIGLNFPDFAQNLSVLSQVFLRLIKTIIAPILFSTLVVGIAGHSSLKQVGRMGWKSILYFEVVTTLALVIGLLAINISRAGDGIVLPQGFEQDLPEAKAQGWKEVVLHVFPENIIKSIYHGDVLPIVVFSVIFGISLALLSEKKKKPILDSLSLAETMFSSNTSCISLHGRGRSLLLLPWVPGSRNSYVAFSLLLTLTSLAGVSLLAATPLGL